MEKHNPTLRRTNTSTLHGAGTVSLLFTGIILGVVLGCNRSTGNESKPSPTTTEKPPPIVQKKQDWSEKVEVHIDSSRGEPLAATINEATRKGNKEAVKAAAKELIEVYKEQYNDGIQDLDHQICELVSTAPRHQATNSFGIRSEVLDEGPMRRLIALVTKREEIVQREKLRRKSLDEATATAEAYIRKHPESQKK